MRMHFTRVLLLLLVGGVTSRLSAQAVNVPPATRESTASGPTLAQTIEYINAYFEDYAPLRTTFTQPALGLAQTEEYSGVTVKADENTLRLDYTETFTTPGKRESKQRHFEIPIKQVELLQIIGTGLDRAKYWVYGIYFKQKGGRPSDSTLQLPIWERTPDFDGEALKDTQIFKAFQHLRKLVGAPDPVTFN